MSASEVYNIAAFEEDSSYNTHNAETFDNMNEAFISVPFTFSNKSWTSREVYDGRFYLPKYQQIGVGDFVCRCGETVYSDHLTRENRGQLSRIYIPRIMTNVLNFYSDQHVKNFIFEQLSTFCNIRDIQLRWLHDAGDLSAFVYLEPSEPLHPTSPGKTAACNLACTKCHSIKLQLTHSVFWNLLPTQCIGFMCI